MNSQTEKTVYKYYKANNYHYYNLTNDQRKSSSSRSTDIFYPLLFLLYPRAVFLRKKESIGNNENIEQYGRPFQLLSRLASLNF